MRRTRPSRQNTMIAPIKDRPRAFRNVFLLSLLLSGCGGDDAPGNATSGVVQPSSVVLTVEMGAGPTRGPIQGSVRCGADAPPVAGPCLPADLPLAEAVLACGPVQVAIDRGTSHLGIVRFAAGLHRRFPGIPPDLEIVRCVQQRVGFPFTAGLATDPAEAIELDQRPFASLHAVAR